MLAKAHTDAVQGDGNKSKVRECCGSHDYVIEGEESGEIGPGEDTDHHGDSGKGEASDDDWQSPGPDGRGVGIEWHFACWRHEGWTGGIRSLGA